MGKVNFLTSVSKFYEPLFYHVLMLYTVVADSVNGCVVQRTGTAYFTSLSLH